MQTSGHALSRVAAGRSQPVLTFLEQAQPASSCSDPGVSPMPVTQVPLRAHSSCVENDLACAPQKAERPRDKLLLT